MDTTKTHRFPRTACAALLAMVLVACGSGDTTPDPTDAPPAGGTNTTQPESELRDCDLVTTDEVNELFAGRYEEVSRSGSSALFSGCAVRLESNGPIELRDGQFLFQVTNDRRALDFLDAIDTQGGVEVDIALGGIRGGSIIMVQLAENRSLTLQAETDPMDMGQYEDSLEWSEEFGDRLEELARRIASRY